MHFEVALDCQVSLNEINLIAFANQHCHLRLGVADIRFEQLYFQHEPNVDCDYVVFQVGHCFFFDFAVEE